MKHYVGELRVTDNPRVVEELSKAPPVGVFTYSQYLEACKRSDTLRTRKLREEREVLTKGAVVQSLLTPTERVFLSHKTASTVDGYARYRTAVDPDFAELLSQTITVYIPEDARLQHTYVCGSSGYGKTELFKTLIHSYVTQPDIAAVVAIDPAGDYVDQIAHWKEFVGNRRLVYFHPRLKKGHIPCINPFELSDTSIEGKQVAAQQLFSALEEILGGTEGGAMSVPMRALLFPSILALLDYPNATLRDLRRLMNDDEELVAFGKSRHHYPDVASFFQESFNRQSYAVTKNSILSKLQDIFSTGIFGDLTCGKSTIDLERCIEKKRVILFNLSKGHLGDTESRAFGRLLMATLQGIAMRRARLPDRDRTVTHVFVDEVQNFLTPSVSTILQEARKFKMVLTMAQPMIGKGMATDLRQAVLGIPNLQMAGYCQPSERRDAANLVDCEPEDLATLHKGEFYVRMGNRKAFRFRARADLLGFRNSMTPLGWKLVRLRQIEAYYRSRHATPEPVAPEPEDVDIRPGTW